MEKLDLRTFLLHPEWPSYQNHDPDESNAKKEFVKVCEDIPLEGWYGGQEATEEEVEVGKKVGVEVGKKEGVEVGKKVEVDVGNNNKK